MRAQVVVEFLEKKEILVEVKTTKIEGEKIRVIRIRAAKKAKRFFNRTIQKEAIEGLEKIQGFSKEDFKALKKSLGIKKGEDSAIVSKNKLIEIVAEFSANNTEEAA